MLCFPSGVVTVLLVFKLKLFCIFICMFRALAKGFEASFNATATTDIRASAQTMQNRRSKLNQAFEGDIETKPYDGDSEIAIYVLKDLAMSVRKWIWVLNKKVP